MLPKVNIFSKALDPLVYWNSLSIVSELEDQILGRGIGASAGAAQGVLVFSNTEAARLKSERVDCILCREETSADDIAGIEVSGKNSLINLSSKVSYLLFLRPQKE